METIASVIDALERAPSIVLPLVREVAPTLVKRRPTPTKWVGSRARLPSSSSRQIVFEPT